MLLPHVLQLLAGYQYQVVVADDFRRIAHNAADAGSVFREVQLILRMAVDGIGELGLAAVGDVEAVTL